jgi:dolichol-phosphate mannosyltransferase
VRVLVVIPTYNEADNIVALLERVRAAVPDAGILVVDDGSPDGTAKLVHKVGERLANVHVFERSGKAGLGSAYRAGFGWGMGHGYDALVEMDADFSHEPEALPGLLEAAQHHDVVIGSRYVPGGSIPHWSVSRLLLSKGGNRYASTVLGLGVADATAGFRVYRATVLRAIDLDLVRADGYGFQIEMTYRAKQLGASIVEVPIRFVDREVGVSKMSSRIVVEALALVTWWGFGRLRRAVVHRANPQSAELAGTARR